MAFSDAHADVPEVNRCKMLPDRILRHLRPVIRGTEVSQPDLGWNAISAGRERLGCGSVADVAMLTEDAALQEVRIWPGLEHLDIVVGFQNQEVIVSEMLLDLRRNMPEIRRHRDCRRMTGDLEADRLDGVMRNLEWQHAHIPNLPMLAGFHRTCMLSTL